MSEVANTPTPATNTENNDEFEDGADDEDEDNCGRVTVDANHRTRDWVFTVFSGESNIDPWTRLPELEEYCKKGKPAVHGLVAACELGEIKKNRHLQGWVSFKHPQAWKCIKAGLPFLSWLAPRKTTSTNWRAAKYCLKGEQPGAEWKKLHENGDRYGEGLREHLIFGIFPDPSVPGKRNDLLTVKRALDAGQSVKSIAQDDEMFATWCRNKGSLETYASIVRPPVIHHDTKGIWVVGESDAGKSHVVREVFDPNLNELYTKAFNKWFCGYNGQPAILIDDLSGCLDNPVLQELLKKWSDKYPLEEETKFGKVALQHKVFIVTAQYSIRRVMEMSYEKRHPDWFDKYKRNIRADWASEHPFNGVDRVPPCPPIRKPPVPVDEKLCEALERRFHQIELEEDNYEEVITALRKLKAYHICSPEESQYHAQAVRKRRMDHKIRRRALRDQGYRKCDVNAIIYLENQMKNETDEALISIIQSKIDSMQCTGDKYKPPSLPDIADLITPENVDLPYDPIPVVSRKRDSSALATPHHPPNNRTSTSTSSTTHQEYVQNRIEALERLRDAVVLD